MGRTGWGLGGVQGVRLGVPVHRDVAQIDVAKFEGGRRWRALGEALAAGVVPSGEKLLDAQALLVWAL